MYIVWFRICLDPCFNPGESLSSLGRGDADFVDIIHSNSGALGLRDPIGDADFFPNGGWHCVLGNFIFRF